MPQEGDGNSGTDTNSCELSHGCWEPNLGPWQEQGEPSFQPLPPLLTGALVLKPAAWWVASSILCFVPHDPFQRAFSFPHGSLFHKDVREKQRLGKTKVAVFWNLTLGSDIPSLLWNPILQELITRYSPHSREGFAHRQECQKVERLIRVHCRAGECAGNLSHIPWFVRRLTDLNL